MNSDLKSEKKKMEKFEMELIESAFEFNESLDIMGICGVLKKLELPTEYLKITNQIKKITKSNSTNLNKYQFIQLAEQLKNPNLLPGFSFVIENELSGMM